MNNYCQNLWEKLETCLDTEKVVSDDFSNSQTLDIEVFKQHFEDYRQAISSLENTWTASLVDFNGEKLFSPQAEAIADFMKENQLPAEMTTNIHNAIQIKDNKIWGFKGVKRTFMHPLMSYRIKLNFDSFRRISSLTNFSCDSTQLFDVSALSSCQKLEVVVLDDCAGLANIDFVRKLPNLEGLGLDGCGEINDFSSLSTSGIRRLSLAKTKFSKLEELSNISSQLVSLDISKTTLADFDFIENFENLESLWVNMMAKKDMSAIGKLINLKQIELDDTRAEDYSFLENLVNLEGLSLERCRVGDLGILRNCHHIIHLGIADARIDSLEPLADSSIETISLGRAEGTDLSPLLDMKKLRSVFLRSSESVSQQEDILQRLRAKGIYVSAV
jgi:Leucine-rich repeat (LRR) protein